MPRKSPTCPEHKFNPRRGKSKLKMGKGLLAIEQAGATQIEWTQKHDPLFHVRGIERHRMMKEIR